MKTVILYLQDKKVIYQIKGKGVEEGEFDIGEAEAFLEKNRPDILNIILAKPHLIFRRIEFPFRNKKKIQMVIPSEIEETLPESPDNFVFSFDFIHTDKNKTVVNVYAIPSTIFNFWDKEAKKYRARAFFFSDTLLFHQFLRQHTNGKKQIGIYEDSGYLVLNITEDGVLTGSYSYFIEQSTLAESMALVNEILSNKNIPVFICAEQNIKQGLSIEKERVRYIDLPVGMNRKYLFHYLSSFKMFRRMFSSVKDTREKKFPVVTSILVLIFLIFSFISFAPYIKITEKQKKLEGIDNEMKQIFLSTFPD
ncbi:MAG: hypothetical protein PHI44_04520, partial [Candidatus Ratteibacteria bacterium]|nr:hypothetical protein [Candidatus Ratteibacteria bacterium]